MNIPIDQGIHPPDRPKGKAPEKSWDVGLKTGLTKALREMKVGESILYRRNKSNLHARANALGFRIITKVEGENIRIWKAE